MKLLFNALKAQLKTKVPEIKTISMWNNQVDRLKEKDPDTPVILLPGVFFEFQVENQYGGIGNNIQITDPLYIIAHIVHEELDAGTGEMEMNFNVYDLKQKVYKALQLFKCDGSGPLDRQGEEQDYDHDNLYHYKQKYATSWVDQDLPLPIDGFEVEPPFTLEITPDID